MYDYSNERWGFKERCYVFLKFIRVLDYPFFTVSIIEKTIKEIVSVYFQAAHHTEQPTDHDPEVFHLLKIRYPETLARVSRSLLVFSYVWSLDRRRIIMLEPILGTLSIWWLVVYANILLLLSPLVLLMIVFLPNFPILLLRRICYIPIESIWPRSIDITSYHRSFTFIIQSILYIYTITYIYNNMVEKNQIKLSNFEWFRFKWFIFKHQKNV